jgi:hypoxanthine phosphoribosyltransferase
MDDSDVATDLETVLLSEEQILARVAELAREIEQDYQDRDLVIVGVLNGAATATADLARAFKRHVEITWVAVRSYGSGVNASGSVRILKDVDIDVTGRDLLVVDGVIDTGLTASWVTSTLRARGAASVRFATMFRKPAARGSTEVAHYVGFDVPAGMIVGYGLDHAGRYRNLRSCALLAPTVVGDRVAASPVAASHAP